MRLLITTMLLFSCLVFAQEGDPMIDVEVFVMEIPPAGEVTSTVGARAVTIKGLPAGAEIVGLPQGWKAGGRGAIILQGPPAGDKITIKFTSPDPNWEAYVAGFIGGESLWDARLLTRDSAGISTMIMKADDVVNSPAAKCLRTKQRADSYNSSSSNNKQTKGERAKASDVVGTWISEPTLGQLGMSQSSYSFQEDGTYSHKLDFISFCDECSGRIDCDYFWMIFEGNYTVQNGIFTLETGSMKRIILPTGQAEPIVTEDPNHPQSSEIMVERQGDDLLIRESAEAEASVFKRAETGI
jgi:hypothetical protein